MNAKWLDAHTLPRAAFALAILNFANPSLLKQPLARALTCFALLAVLMVGFTANAFAVATGCRGDPIIELSNGHTIQVEIAITAAPEQVQSVVYEVHVPAGVTATNVTYIGEIDASKESIVLYNDAKVNANGKINYVVETTVTLGGSGGGKANRISGASANGDNKPEKVQTIGWLFDGVKTLDKDQKNGKTTQELNLKLESK